MSVMMTWFRCVSWILNSTDPHEQDPANFTLFPGHNFIEIEKREEGKVTRLLVSRVTCYFSPRWWGWTNRSRLGLLAEGFMFAAIYYANLQLSVTYFYCTKVPVGGMRLGFRGLTAPPRGRPRMCNDNSQIFSFQRWSPSIILRSANPLSGRTERS